MRDSREPRQLAGAIYHPGGGFHSYPPPKARFVAGRKVCGHCGLAAFTPRDSCPVCADRYAGGRRLARMLRRFKRAAD